MTREEIVSEIIFNISNLKDELVEGNGIISFNKQKYPTISVQNYDLLSRGLRINNIDRYILNYIRHNNDRVKMLDMRASTLDLDNEVSQDLVDIKNKLKDEKVLEAVSKWFDIYETVKLVSENNLIERENRDILMDIANNKDNKLSPSDKEVLNDDWVIYDEIEKLDNDTIGGNSR